MPDYNNLYQIAMALKAGAGNGPGQTHVDDYIRQNQISQAPNAGLFERMNEYKRPTGKMNDPTGGAMLDYDNAQKQYELAKKLDPNARLELIGDPGRENYGPEGNAINQYILHMDNSKLPAFKGDNQDVSNSGGWRGIPQGGLENLYNPKMVVNDPNYGDFTAGKNIKPEQAGGGLFSQTEKYMPAVVGMAMSGGVMAGAGTLIGPMINMAMKYAQSGSMDKAGALMQIAKLIASQGRG